MYTVKNVPSRFWGSASEICPNLPTHPNAPGERKEKKRMNKIIDSESQLGVRADSVGECVVHAWGRYGYPYRIRKLK